MLTHTEGIITQLVFDYMLRVRMKEEAKPSSTPTTEANTQDTLSITNTKAENESLNNEEETLEGSAHT